ncbi:serine protease [Ferrimonas balearica]|nr:serine protease [Ferrimonas balearica]
MLDILRAAAAQGRDPSDAHPALGFLVTDAAGADASSLGPRIATLLGGEGFTLAPLPGAKGRVLLLGFAAPTTALTNEQHRALAEELGSALDLPVSPDLAWPAPGLLVSQPAQSRPVGALVRKVAAARANGLESATSMDDETAVARLRADGAGAVLEQAETAFAARRQPGGAADPAAQAEALQRMRPVIEQIAAGEQIEEQAEAEARFALEALVRLTGRPAVRMRGDGSEIEDPLLGSWKEHLAPTRADWRARTDAIGRIEVEVTAGQWLPAGTGVLISDGQVLTNRHVLDQIALPVVLRDGTTGFAMRWPAYINFDPDAQAAETRFALPGVISAGQFPIGRRMDLAKLDMAVLAMEMDNGAAEPPFALPSGVIGCGDGSVGFILLAGYPVAPHPLSGPVEAEDPTQHRTFWDRIEELYGEEYGVKYLSPGEITGRSGTVEGDARGWAFTHDATTLGGNSGSLILSLAGQTPVCGLHFGGQALADNYAHDIAAVIEAGGDGTFDASLLRWTGA